MTKLKKILKNLLFVTLPMLIILFILLEIISRIFFPGCEMPKNVWDEKEHLIKFGYEYGKSGLFTKGNLSQIKGKWTINNDGWNSPIDYTPEKRPGIKRIAVIGDSYIEAFQVNSDKNYPSLLRDSLGSNYEVYSFGVSQTPLSQYLFLSRYVEKKYSPDMYIFNLVHNDFHESVNGMAYIPMYMTIKMNSDSSFTEIEPVKPERITSKIPAGKILRKSSFFRYLFYNLNLMEKLKTKKQSAKEAEMNVLISDVVEKKDTIKYVTAYLLKKIKAELGNKELLFVMDAPRTNIYDGDMSKSKIAWLNNTVDSICKEENLNLIDLTSYMQKDFQQNGKRFESKIDNHWAGYGHQVVAGIVYNYLKSRM